MELLINFEFDGLLYLGLNTAEIREVTGSQAESIIRTAHIEQTKKIAHSELSTYDWMYVREYRMANTATPMPVPEHIATHYETVRQWVDQQEQLLASMTIEQLEAHEFIVPTL